MIVLPLIMFRKWLWEKFENLIDDIYYRRGGGFYGSGIKLLLMLIFLPFLILYKILDKD